MEKIELGREVRCKVTGFIGISTARIEYLNGCFKICVQPKADKDGKHPDGMYIDEPQIEYTKNKRNVLGAKPDENKPLANRGGPSLRAPKNSI